MWICKKLSMVNQGILTGIMIGVFLAGFGISYGIFEAGDVPTNRNFISMISNPQMQNQMMNAIMEDEHMRQEMAEMMTDSGVFESSSMHNEASMRSMMMGSGPMEEHEMMLEMSEIMVEDEQLRNHMFAHMMENDKTMHELFTFLSQSPELKNHMNAHVTGELSDYEHLDAESPHEDDDHDDTHS